MELSRPSLASNPQQANKDAMMSTGNNVDTAELATTSYRIVEASTQGGAAMMNTSGAVFYCAITSVIAR